MDERLQTSAYILMLLLPGRSTLLALFIIQQGSKKVPVVSKLENDSLRATSFSRNAGSSSVGRKKPRLRDGDYGCKSELGWDVSDENF